jgi:hemoglobin/transferrin/lactoferrin receptor protein
MKISTYIICSLLLLQNVLHAQIMTIKDAVTLEPLTGVVVTSENKSSVSDAEGRLDIATFKNQTVIQLWAIGYDRYTFTYDQIAASNFEVYMFSSGLYSNEVVVSASKFEEKSSDVAQPIIVIDRKTLQFQSQQTSADVLQQSGLVHVQKSQQGGGSPIIRGFEANKVLIVVDGVRMNNAIYRGGHLQDIITIDNSMLEKVEVAFGPGSVIYGSDALGGVMHFYTKNPKFSSTDKMQVDGSGMLRYSTVNKETTENIMFNLGGKRWAYLMNANYSIFDDLKQGADPLEIWKRNEYVQRINNADSVIQNNDPTIQVGSAYRQFDMLHKLSFKQNENTIHTLSFQSSSSSNVPRYDRLTQYRNGALRFAEWYYGPQRRNQLTYALNLNSTTAMYDQSRLTIAYQDIEQSRNSRSFNKNALNRQLEEVNVVSFNADFSKDIKGGGEIRYGAEYYTNEVNSSAQSTNIQTGEITPTATRYADGGSTFSGLAAYVTHSWEISPKLVLTDGVRFNQVTLNAQFNDTTFFPFPFKNVEQNNIATTGSIGLIAHPNATWKLSILGSTGFRAPNVDDLSKVFESVAATRDENNQLTTLGNLIIPNPNLKPEFTYNADAGVSKTIAKKATVTLNAFYTAYRDAITTDYTTLNGEAVVQYNGDSSYVVTSVNKTKAYIYGGSAQLVYQINKSFELNSAITYTYGRIQEETGDTPLDHIPPLFGRTGLTCQYKKLRAEIWSMYNAEKPIKDYRLGAEDNESNAPETGMPSWYTLNIRGGYQLNQHLRVQLAVENIMDTNYRLFASNISAPGRNIQVTLRANL